MGNFVSIDHQLQPISISARISNSNVDEKSATSAVHNCTLANARGSRECPRVTAEPGTALSSQWARTAPATPTTADDWLCTLRERHTATIFTPVVASICGLISIASLVSPVAGLPSLLPLAVIPVVAAIDRKRRTTSVEYDPGDPTTSRRIDLIDRIGTVIHGTSGVWSIPHSVGAQNPEYASWADSNVRRVRVASFRGTPDRIKCNVPAWTLQIDAITIVLLPDYLLTIEGFQVDAFAYEQIQPSVVRTAFVELEHVPDDSEILATRWLFQRMDGGRDFRYNDNRQLPVMEYGELTLKLGKDREFIFQISSMNAARAISFHFEQLRDLRKPTPASIDEPVPATKELPSITFALPKLAPMQTPKTPAKDESHSKVIAELDAEIGKKRKALAILSADMTERHERIAKLSAMADQLDSEIIQKRGALLAEVTSVDIEIEQKKRTLSAITDNLERNRREFESIDRKIRSKSDQLRDVELDIQAKEARARKDVERNVEREYKAEQRRRESELRSIESKIATQHLTLDSLATAIHALQAKQLQLKQDIAEKKTELKQLGEAIENFNAPKKPVWTEPPQIDEGYEESIEAAAFCEETDDELFEILESTPSVMAEVRVENIEMAAAYAMRHMVAADGKITEDELECAFEVYSSLSSEDVPYDEFTENFRKLKCDYTMYLRSIRSLRRLGRDEREAVYYALHRLTWSDGKQTPAETYLMWHTANCLRIADLVQTEE